MKILLLAPHPFYQERGTPIAVDLLLTVLSRRGDQVDVATYHEGETRAYPGVTLHRIPRLPGIRRIPPGFSGKKLICDLFLMVKALSLARRGHYQLVHAVEESVFVAMLIRLFWRTPYVFDMDSSLPLQMTEKFWILKPLLPLLKFFEGCAIRRAFAVVPVCEALAQIAQRYAPRKLCLLRDISLLAPAGGGKCPPILAGARHPCFLYIGNLERYQGVDLLLESFALFLRSNVKASLVIAGGQAATIRHYQQKAGKLLLTLDEDVRFLGPWPVSRMADLFAAADVLVSPRIRGNNTPMKIYSYLQSGKPILATALPSHTQVLTSEVALLKPPTPEGFAEGMRQLIEQPELGRQMAARAMALAEKKYTFKAFEQTARELYAWLERMLIAEQPQPTAPAQPG